MNKIGRNDRCPCGSGKKFKKCHIDAPAISSVSERRDNLPKIAAALAKALRIGTDSLCFCGSCEVFGRCCGSNSKEALLFLQNAFDLLEAYKTSQGGKIKSIPLGIWKRCEEASINRLTCVYPGCSRKLINSHLIPENILRSHFGSYCKEYRRMSDNALIGQFVKTATGKAGTLPVFCSEHDNKLFREIDTLEIDFLSQKHLFLLALKAIAFSFRRIQYLSGIDSQVELIRPCWINQNSNPSMGTHFEINIDFLQEQYIRFIANNGFLRTSIKAYESQQWDFFSYFHCSISYEKALFFGGFLNPSHDLEGRKLNGSGTAIAMSCNIFTKESLLHVILGCPDGQSKASYAGLLEQLRAIGENLFITVINNFLTVAADKPLLPEAVSFTEAELRKINEVRQLAGECLKSPNKTFDLKNAAQAISFIEMPSQF